MRPLFTLLLLLVLPSCAAIVCRKTGHVPIDSVPPGAVVSYKGANVGVTPCTVAVHRRDRHVILKMAGYHDQAVEAGTGTSAWILGNLVFGGLIGIVVDLAGGATTVDETHCWVELTPTSDPLPAVWTQPRAEPLPEPAWIPEGEVAPAPLVAREKRATRAPALQTAPPPARAAGASSEPGDFQP